MTSVRLRRTVIALLTLLYALVGYVFTEHLGEFIQGKLIWEPVSVHSEEGWTDVRFMVANVGFGELEGPVPLVFADAFDRPLRRELEDVRVLRQFKEGAHDEATGSLYLGQQLSGLQESAFQLLGNMAPGERLLLQCRFSETVAADRITLMGLDGRIERLHKAIPNPILGSLSPLRLLLTVILTSVVIGLLFFWINLLKDTESTGLLFLKRSVRAMGLPVRIRRRSFYSWSLRKGIHGLVPTTSIDRGTVCGAFTIPERSDDEQGVGLISAPCDREELCFRTVQDTQLRHCLIRVSFRDRADLHWELDYPVVGENFSVSERRQVPVQGTGSDTWRVEEFSLADTAIGEGADIILRPREASTRLEVRAIAVAPNVEELEQAWADLSTREEVSPGDNDFLRSPLVLAAATVMFFCLCLYTGAVLYWQARGLFVPKLVWDPVQGAGGREGATARFLVENIGTPLDETIELQLENRGDIRTVRKLRRVDAHWLPSRGEDDERVRVPIEDVQLKTGRTMVLPVSLSTGDRLLLECQLAAGTPIEPTELRITHKGERLERLWQAVPNPWIGSLTLPQALLLSVLVCILIGGTFLPLSLMRDNESTGVLLLKKLFRALGFNVKIRHRRAFLWSLEQGPKGLAPMLEMTGENQLVGMYEPHRRPKEVKFGITAATAIGPQMLAFELLSDQRLSRCYVRVCFFDEDKLSWKLQYLSNGERKSIEVSSEGIGGWRVEDLVAQQASVGPENNTADFLLKATSPQGATLVVFALAVAEDLEELERAWEQVELPATPNPV